MRIDATPELLAARVSDLASPLPAGLVFRRDRSAFVNYSAGWSGNAAWDLTTESGVNIRGALVNSTLSATPHQLTRGLTNLTIDDRSRLRRWVFGDSFAQTDALGGRCIHRRRDRHKGVRRRSLLRPTAASVNRHPGDDAVGGRGLRQRADDQSGVGGARPHRSPEPAAHPRTQRCHRRGAGTHSVRRASCRRTTTSRPPRSRRVSTVIGPASAGSAIRWKGARAVRRRPCSRGTASV